MAQIGLAMLEVYCAGRRATMRELTTPSAESLQIPSARGGRLHRNRWQTWRGISGRLAVERVAALLWNRWQTSPGIRSLHRPRLAERLTLAITGAKKLQREERPTQLIDVRVHGIVRFCLHEIAHRLRSTFVPRLRNGRDTRLISMFLAGR